MAGNTNYLLFPAGMAESLAFKSTIEVAGHHIIGASSVASDPAMALYDSWVSLPFIGTPQFDEALMSAIAAHQVGVIFTPHAVIARHLQRLHDEGKITAQLIIEPFARRATAMQLATLARAQQMLQPPFALALTNEAPALTALELAALMQHAQQIVGSTSDEKLLAMAEIFRSCPSGDVVEIGTFWGRSAAILAMLATRYAIGPLLCIDPWQNSSAIQQGTHADVNDATAALDFEAAFCGFVLAVKPYAAPGKVNYLRMPSDVGITRYTSPCTITSAEFGTSTYSGQIACLHIDGNHGQEAAQRDIEYWVPRMMKGGWVIIDDYQWAFGQGPAIAADEWLRQHPSRIDRAFAIGSALFIRLM